MSASKKQSFTLYLLTLLFLWVNGFAAPYQSLQNASSQTTAAVVENADCYISQNDGTSIHKEFAVVQLPNSGTNHGIHSTDPAEETFEEQEESELKDDEGLFYVSLPAYLTLSRLSTISYPQNNSQHNDFSAMRKQSTYLLDCTFLI